MHSEAVASLQFHFFANLMENILYFTGGIALVAFAWLMVLLAKTMKTVQTTLVEARQDLHDFQSDIHEIKLQVMPILDSMQQLTIRANVIADSVQSQMVTIQETVDDTLDVVRGTIDDVERLKNEVVGIVEGPLRMARSTSDGAIGTITKGVTLLAKLFATRKNGKN
jgi:uncharacterized protein YoxC